MAGNPRHAGWLWIPRYAFGGTLCLLTAAAMRDGLPWYFGAVMLVVALAFILGRRRIFRAAVIGNDSEVVCRYVPWFEGNAYLLNLGLPVIAIASLCSGFAPGNPGWLCFSGAVLLVLTPIFPVVAVRNWRRCFLRFTPTMLTVRLPRGEAITVERERVKSITPIGVANGLGGRWPQVEIAYEATALNSSSTMQIVIFGLQLTVEPGDLLTALVAWNGATDYESGELLNLIGDLLRGRTVNM